MHHRRLGRSAVAALAVLLVLPTAAVGHEGRDARARAPDRTPDFHPAATSLDFGEVLVGTTSAGLDFTYTNETVGDVTVSFAIADAVPVDGFAVATDGCTGVAVPPGGTCTLTVVFTPKVEYAHTATLSVTDSQPSTVTLPLAGVGVLAPSGVAWGATRTIGSAYTWTQGTALARTVSGSTQYLHAVVQRYDVSRQGIYYRRATTGTKWPYVTRLNPTTQHAGRSTIAAAGSYVYVAWSSFARANPTATQPRVLYFRSNRAHGSGTWNSVKRLTSTTGRIDFPRLAASGSRVYVTYTDAATGSIKIKISKDRGANWRTVSLGTTSRYDKYGKYGFPVVAAASGIVAVAWVSSASGTVKLRWSSDYGATWKSATTVGTGADVGSWPSIAALGSRVAVAWVDGNVMKIRVRSGTKWGPVRTVLPSAGEPAAEWAWSGAVVLNGTTRVGIAWESCRAGCREGDPDTALRADLLWRESADNGSTWFRSQVVGLADGDYTEVYYPSVLWPTSSTRYVMASRWYAPNLLDNVPFRAGTGSP